MFAPLSFRRPAAAQFPAALFLAAALMSGTALAQDAQPAAPAPAATAPAAPVETAPAAPAATAPAETPAPAAPTAAAAPAPVSGVPADDNLNAVLWMQHSAEYEASVQTAFSLAELRLQQALKDKKWTAAPEAQKGKFAALPPAIICDIDETLLDNSAYQAWNITAGTPFSNETWSKFVAAKISKAVPGAVGFTKYAVSKNVKVFYVSNRTAEGEEATRANMEKLGFPMGNGVDTFLLQNEKPEWTSKKGSRVAAIAKKYRILLKLGDNLGDFTDAYKGTEADRQKVYDQNAAHWGHDWIMLPNPSYGSFEAVPYGFNYGASPEEMRAAKRAVLESWSGQ
jgi:acid phosphatase